MYVSDDPPIGNLCSGVNILSTSPKKHSATVVLWAGKHNWLLPQSTLVAEQQKITLPVIPRRNEVYFNLINGNAMVIFGWMDNPIQSIYKCASFAAVMAVINQRLYATGEHLVIPLERHHAFLKRPHNYHNGVKAFLEGMATGLTSINWPHTDEFDGPYWENITFVHNDVKKHKLPTRIFK